MKVLITDNAYSDIQEFINFSLASDKNLTSYLNAKNRASTNSSNQLIL